ncbi:DUF6371 domain-containing protein [Mangrovimonas cancribranchiae]|uniref:DUF6371 domain-containing protein n=1 Tax=Mangrovimonas cancribranchiae TaxID=3080055 RepID=A0AAU6P5W6_9FLAO
MRKLEKIDTKYKFSRKRDRNIITPCCNKKNGGGFVHYENQPKRFGYCHYCDTTTLPPILYKDSAGNLFTYNDVIQQFESYNSIVEPIVATTQPKTTSIPQKFIPENKIWDAYSKLPENNLLKYLRKTYGDNRVDKACKEYALGTSDDGGVMFWSINTDLQVQKLKISYYDTNGRRKKKFKAPYLNDKGYYSCLFGEHLLIPSCKDRQRIVLVESEKTAIVGSIVLPKFTWLAYGGLTQLTVKKAHCLKGYQRVLVIPDFSSKAIKAISKRITELKELGINLNILDLTQGMTDTQRDNLGIYGYDLEDIIRKIPS